MTAGRCVRRSRGLVILAAFVPSRGGTRPDDRGHRECTRKGVRGLQVPSRERRKYAEAVRVAAAFPSAFLGYAPPKPTHTAQGDVAAVSLMP